MRGSHFTGVLIEKIIFFYTAKMQAMEKELQQLREQVGTGPAHNRKRPHPQSNTAMRKSDKPSPKPAPVMSSIAMATKSSTTSLKRSLSANRGASGVNDRSVAEGLITQRQQDKEINIHTDTFSGIRIKYIPHTHTHTHTTLSHSLSLSLSLSLFSLSLSLSLSFS